ncbi:hypothetical protein ABZ462_18760, partial [Streptomyces albogriseolus]
MAVPELIRIVSRDSPMALAQVERVRAELTAAHPGVRTEVVPVPPRAYEEPTTPSDRSPQPWPSRSASPPSSAS